MVNDLAVLVFTENDTFQLIRSHNFCSCDSAQLMDTGDYMINFYFSTRHYAFAYGPIRTPYILLNLNQ